MKEAFDKLAGIKHEIVLFSLLVVLFGPLFISNEAAEVFQPILFAQTIFAGIILFNNNKIIKPVFIIFLIAVLLLYVVDFFTKTVELAVISRGIYIICFILISYETYMQIYWTKKVSSAMVSAVFTGFILLSLIAGLYFMLIESMTPHSFSNIGSIGEQYNNLSYYSFMTTLTIGYGDIVPLTMHAKKATMLIGLIGNFYSVIVTGIIIGKYIQQKQ